MAGWLVAWSRDAPELDLRSWAPAVRAALRYGGSVSEYFGGRAAMAAWRREGGEFPMSGTIVQRNAVAIAWTGQCVADAGDATSQAITQVGDERLDEPALANLNGPFAAATIRTHPFEVRVLTDRHRHYPVYTLRNSAFVVASTEIRCIVPWLERPGLNGDAADMLLRCGELIDRETLLNDVEILPPGTVLRDSGTELSERRYWQFRSDSGAASAPTAADLAEALTTGVRRLEAAAPRPGITLSGGLDSRIILDLCRRPELIPSFTWGLPGCRDITCASEFAALVRSPHTVKHWQPEAYPPLWRRGVDLTGGACGIDSMFMLPFVPLLGSACDVVLNGLAGDVAFGGNWLKRGWLNETDVRRLGRSVWRWRVSTETDRLVDHLTRRPEGAALASERWASSIAAREGARPVERLNDWFVENRIFRTTNCGTMLLRGGVESHAPFFDNDFIDMLSRVDQARKFKHRLYLAVMNQAAPRAASVRWQRTNVKPARGYYLNLGAMAYQKIIGRICAPMGIEPFKDLRVADPAAWFRGAWRKPVEETVLASRFLDRGLVDADAVKRIFRSHLSGADHSRLLGALMTVELFSRMAIDGDVG